MGSKSTTSVQIQYHLYSASTSQTTSIRGLFLPPPIFISPSYKNTEISFTYKRHSRSTQRSYRTCPRICGLSCSSCLPASKLIRHHPLKSILLSSSQHGSRRGFVVCLQPHHKQYSSEEESQTSFVCHKKGHTIPSQACLQKVSGQLSPYASRLLPLIQLYRTESFEERTSQ